MTDIEGGFARRCDICNKLMRRNDGHRLSKDCVDLLLRDNRLDSTKKNKKKLFACLHHFDEHPPGRFKKGDCLKYIKKERDAPVYWNHSVSGRGTSASVSRKRRLSDLSELEALSLANRKKMRKEKEEALLEAREHKRKTSLVRPSRNAGPAQRTAYEAFKEVDGTLFGFDRDALSNIEAWSEEQATANVALLVRRMYSKISANESDKMELEPQIRGGGADASKPRMFDLYSLTPMQWRAYSSFHSKEEFFNCIGNYLDNIEEGRRGPKNSRFSLKERALWLLLHLYCGLSTRFIGSCTGASHKHVAKSILLLIDKLQSWARGQISLPSTKDELLNWYSEQSSELKAAFPGRLLLSVDGTPIPMFEPRSFKMARQMFSFKYQQACYRFFVLVSSDGLVRYLSDVYDGSTHDATMFDKAKTRKSLEATFEHLGQPPWNLGDVVLTPAIAGDKAYGKLSVPMGWELIITKSGEKGVGDLEEVGPIGRRKQGTRRKRKPKKRPQNKRKRGKKQSNADVELVEDEEETEVEVDEDEDADDDSDDDEQDEVRAIFDMNVAPFRTEVERTFAKIKRFRKLINGILRLKDRSVLEKILVVICGIVNWQITNRKI